ncbi:DUF3050 domain-containing protein [Burkholderia cenocepacia]|uniref:DUF3050 domain-containing protein n=1 Tax=Burkholderia cenocepacia TaxID=95486 RepID=UPI001B96786E|nr:DUF3050 domain-containing protein [Burkholderia cenocepacia]MBR8278385.1 DUF3050 domain-containing protein [Burkholderia cenocepacia]
MQSPTATDFGLIERNEAQLRANINRLQSHSLYSTIKTAGDIRVFMEHHVFAVWDFMNLVKSLQIKLTCVNIPWVPQGNPALRNFINEIVTGEESDYLRGYYENNVTYCSHFELYCEAMRRAGANLQAVDEFLSILVKGAPIQRALQECGITDAVSNFVLTTWGYATSSSAHVVAAAFTYGREDPIPGMFRNLLRSTVRDSQFELFRIYMERHVATDEGYHSRKAHYLLQELCDTPNKRLEAIEAAAGAVRARIELWDAIENAIGRARVQPPIVETIPAQPSPGLTKQ